MKKSTKWIITSIFLAVFAVQIGIVVIFREKIHTSGASLAAIFFFVIAFVYGLYASALRHKKNLLCLRYYPNPWLVLFADDDESTYTEQYERMFDWMLVVFCAPLPFYIPLIFFSTHESQIWWVLLLFFLPQIVFFIQLFVAAVKKQKENRKKQEREEQELREQQKREELGKFK